MTTTSPRSSGLAAGERTKLGALLRELGPGAPTLCEGWTNTELAAHLVTREGRPDALVGVLVPALHSYTARLEQRTVHTVPFPELVRRIESGPPLGRSLVGLPFLDDQVNLHEFFVHHEDVRRAQPGWKRRELPADLEAGLWKRLSLVAPINYRGLSGVRLTLAAPDGRQRTVGRGAQEVTLRGPVSELFLYSFGRRGAADVTVDGSEAGKTTLAALPLAM